MARPIITNFTTGELSPKMMGRVDFDKYASGCEVLRNFVILPHGGVTRRPGTYFAAEVKDSTKFTRLIPFQFSTVQAYMLEFGDEYIRFYKDNGQIMDGSSPYEITSPYLEAELPELHFTQSADVMYIAHGSHPPMKLSRTGHTSWTLAEVEILKGPYTSPRSATITPSDAHESFTLECSEDIFTEDDVGRLIAIQMDDDKYYSCKITEYTAADEVVVSNQETDDLPNTNAADHYKLGKWCVTNGFPRTCTFYEQRLVFAATEAKPQTIWGSQSADFENFELGTDDGDAYEFTISDDEVNAIIWMIPRDVLILGTTGGEARICATSNTEAITPSNVSCRIPTNRGSSDVKPLRIGASTLFVQRGGKTVREIVYDLDTDTHKADSISILSEHLTRGVIVDAAYQQEPYSIAWFVREDGILLGCTFLKEHNIIGWHWHDTQGTIESIACIQGAGGEDELWMIVNRTVGGAEKRYVEYMMPYEYEDQEDGFFVDCGLTYDSTTATSTLTGLDHLEGLEVQVVVDGATHAERTVASGDIALGTEGYVIHAGLGYESHLKTVNLEVQTPSGSGQGRYKRINECTIKFLSTLGAKVGRDATHLDSISFRSTSDPMGSPPPLFTGDKVSKVFRGDWSTGAWVYLVQDLPQPMTVLSIMPVIDIKEA